MHKQRGLILSHYLYETFGTARKLEQNENELIAGFASKNLSFSFTGNLTEFTLSGEVDEANIYQDGRLLQYRKIYKTTSNGSAAIQTANKKTTGLECTYWYWVTEYTDGHSTWEFLGKTCTCNGQQQSTSLRDAQGTMTIKLNCDDGGGGGSSDPGGDGPCPPQTTQSIKNNKVVLTVKPSCDIVVLIPKPDTAKFCSGVTSAQQQAIKNVLNVLKSADCLSSTLYNKVSSDISNYCVSPNMSAQGGFSPSDKSILIKDPSTVSVATVQEELFHAYQDKVLGGTGQYLGMPGSANIEFEAKVIRDSNAIVNGTGGAYAVAGQAYSDFIQDITANFTSLPSSFTSSQLSQYFNLIVEFKNQNPAYANTIIDYNLNPSAMFSLINSSPCNH